MSDQMFTKVAGDMEALFLHKLFCSFGSPCNADPFQQLAHRVPKTVIHQQRANVMDIEAILFGQSGLLPAIPVDGYSAELLYRYINFQYKYGLAPMNPKSWKFKKTSDFPTIRIAQLAMLLHGEKPLYSKCTNIQMESHELRAILQVCASDYWDEHLLFGIYSEKCAKKVNEDVVNSILVHAVDPVRELVRMQRDGHQ